MSSKLIIPQTTGEPDYGYFGRLNAPPVITVPDAQKKAMLEQRTLKDIWQQATPEQKLLAAKNLGKLAVNFGLDFIPGVGDIKSAQEAITGTQPMLEGVPGVESKLTMPERIGAAVGALPFVPNIAGALKKVKTPTILYHSSPEVFTKGKPDLMHILEIKIGRKYLRMSSEIMNMKLCYLKTQRF